ncbi:hypothetical protein IAU60_001223 [Kwoniella sp. DSM 27419]
MPAHTLRWGIIATGKISHQFAKDLLVDPSSRQVSDVVHKITAVGSRSKESAQKFIDELNGATESDSWSWGVKNGGLDGAKAHTYEDLYQDPDALLAGKHVLCEKPFTIDIEELDDLIAIAKDKNLFLMEAVWTRFHPIAYAVEEVINSGKLGKPKRFSADFSMDFGMDGDRMLDPALGGGSLLDMGPYPAVWAMLMVHRNPHNKDKNPKVVSSFQTVYPRTGVDINSRWVVEWEGLCQGALLTDLDSAGLREGTAALQCEEGDLPETFHIVPRPDRYLAGVKEKTTHHIPVAAGNSGMSYEADEVARCVRDGKIQSDRMPWDESKVTQLWFDHVRKNGPSATKGMKGEVGR